MAKCTCGSQKDPHCPLHGTEKWAVGAGKPPDTRTHASDRKLPVEKRQRAGCGKRTGEVLAEAQKE